MNGFKATFCSKWGVGRGTENKHAKMNTYFDVGFFLHATVKKQNDKTATALGKQLQVHFQADTYSRLDINTHGSFKAKHTEG